MKKFVISFLLFFTASFLLAQQPSHLTIAGRDIAVWMPSGATPASGYPVIVFSHGFGGCNTQSKFLMEAFVHAGYLVVAPNHADARCGSAQTEEGWYPGKLLSQANRGDRAKRLGQSGGGRRPQESFRKDEDWSDATYKDRAADVRALLDAVLRDKTFQGVTVDAQRVGIAGHSLGGYTALGMSGAWPSWKDPRFKAVLALSPFCTPYVSHGDLEHMKIPVMYQGGTRDFGITPSVKRLDGAYDHSSAPKFYVEFEGASHFAWTNLQSTHHALISEYSLAFVDRYVKGTTSRSNFDALTSLTSPGKHKGVSYLKADPK